MLSPKFFVNLKNSEVTHYNADTNYDISAYIEWEAEIEFRDYGIKDITKMINLIRLHKEWTTWSDDKDSDIYHSGVETLELSEWTIDTDFQCSISQMEIDFKDKKITLL